MLLKSSAFLLPRIPLIFSPLPTSTICMRKMSSKTNAAPATFTPVYPKFIPVEQKEITSVSKSDGIKFRLVSYNILAQELDEYDNFYKEKIEQHGYSSVYIKRSGRKSDGCGIFYKRNKLEFVMEERIDYNDLASLILDETSCKDQKEKAPDASSKGEGKTERDLGDLNDPYVRLKRDCVGIMAAFKFKDPCQHYIIVTDTHLYWDPELADVKLAQAKYLLSRVAQFKKTIADKFECTPSVVIAGDFNSVPGNKVYQYLVSGGSMAAPSPECLEDVPIPLSSVYAYTRGEPQFTNCTPGFTGTLDYIFFSPSEGIEPVAYLELPEPDSTDVSGGLPNYFHPSDHLPIGAEFALV